MTRKTFRWLVSVALLAVAGQSAAAGLTAEILYNDCVAGKPVCDAYFAGFTQAAFTYEQMRQGIPGVEPRFCPKGKVGVQEIIRLFKERMTKYPATRSSPAIAEVFRTLENAFPCEPEPSTDTEPATGERFRELPRRPNLVIQHILSSDRPEPVDYCQDEDEWVLLLQGSARIDGAL